MDATKQATANTTDDLAAQLARLREELAAIRQAVADSGKAGQVAAGQCSCAACTDAASKIAHHVKQNVDTVISEIETLARHNPGYVLGGALGVGAILGMLAMKRAH